MVVFWNVCVMWSGVLRRLLWVMFLFNLLSSILMVDIMFSREEGLLLMEVMVEMLLLFLFLLWSLFIYVFMVCFCFGCSFIMYIVIVVVVLFVGSGRCKGRVVGRILLSEFGWWGRGWSCWGWENELWRGCSGVLLFWVWCRRS